MKPAEILDVLEIYEITLSFHSGRSDELDHIFSMIPDIEKFVEEGRIGKAFRWLGFMQGVLYCARVYTIDEMRSHNKSGSNEEIDAITRQSR